MQALPLDVDACVDLVQSTKWAAKVDRSDARECWLWTGAINSDGYGHVWLGGKVRGAHRVAWVAANRCDIPAGLAIDHLCRIRSCVRAEHLEPVTGRENTLRGYTQAAAQASRTHCIRGHELTGDNLLRSALAKNKRMCRSCARDGDALRREAARSLGMTQDTYFAEYGKSRFTAEQVLGPDLTDRILSSQRAWL